MPWPIGSTNPPMCIGCPCGPHICRADARSVVRTHARASAARQHTVHARRTEKSDLAWIRVHCARLRGRFPRQFSARAVCPGCARAPAACNRSDRPAASWPRTARGTCLQIVLCETRRCVPWMENGNTSVRQSGPTNLGSMQLAGVRDSSDGTGRGSPGPANRPPRVAKARKGGQQAQAGARAGRSSELVGRAAVYAANPPGKVRPAAERCATLNVSTGHGTCPSRRR